VQDVGEDLEQVEVMQKKFDDFRADLKANEVRLAEMNEIAMRLTSLGQTEAALKIKTQFQVRKAPIKNLQSFTGRNGLTHLQRAGSFIAIKNKVTAQTCLCVRHY